MSEVRRVSVIVPCRNERDHIDAFCQSVLQQQIPPGWTLDVWIADGMSDDGTRERLAAWCEQDDRFHMIDNPGRIVSCGLNLCIQASSGEFLVRLDVHTVYEPDYVAQCLAVWQQTGADNVGGPWRAQGEPGRTGVVQRAVAAAFQSKWVAGGALSRDLTYDGEVDTVYLGAWPRATFERFGLFDENLVRNQDDEHNLRLHQGGAKVWQSPTIQSTYFPRASKLDVFRQYRQYGYWKPFVMRKHGQAAAWRHLVPGVFVGVLCGLIALALICGLLGLWRPDPFMAWALVLGTLAAVQGALYGTAVVIISWLIGRAQGRDLLWHLPDVIGAYHFGYGLGSIRGWWDVCVRGRPDPAFGRLTR